MLYNVVLVSAIPQGESAIIICIPLGLEPPSPPATPPPRSPRSARLNSLCYIATSHQLSVSHLMIEHLLYAGSLS